MLAAETLIPDGTIDLSREKLYTREFGPKSKHTTVYDYDVQLPIEPPDYECINYRMPIDDQIFRHTYIPDDLEYWEESEREYFVSNEHHRRREGVWIFIKGKKLYIPGIFYYYLNYWTSKKFGKITFLYTDLEFFLVWMHCVRDPKCYGLIDFKCRQIGDTEKVICILYEYASRVRRQICAMQSAINETHVKSTYRRLIHAHSKMVWFMKPINKGVDNPEGGLQFMYPSDQVTNKKIQSQNKYNGTVVSNNKHYAHQALDSEVQYGPTEALHFDGGTYGRWYLDEFGKAHKMNPIEALGVIKPAIFNEMFGKMVGKIIMTSTVEEGKSGDSLKWSKDLWNKSDPKVRNENGETLSGLYRIFRSSLDRGTPDKWGFPMREEAKAKIEATTRGLLMAGDMKGLIKYKRKNPVTISDVFMSTQDESQFDVEKLAERQYYLEFMVKVPTAVRGNLKWKDNVKDSEVIWEPNSNGRWLISKHPENYGLESNAKATGVIMPKPANTHAICMGVDPYDQKSVLTDDPSLGGICVKRKLDEFLDGDTSKYHQQDVPESGIRAGDPMDGGRDFLTNRIIATYLFRQNDPNDFYEDVLMTAVYFGTDFLPEKNRSGGLLTYIELRKHHLYLMERPKLGSTTNAKGQVEQHGITANEDTIDTYFSYIQTVSAKWWNTIDHPDILEQWLSMNYKNKGEKDLGVAGGWCEVASMVPRLKPKERSSQKRRYFKTYEV